MVDSRRVSELFMEYVRIDSETHFEKEMVERVVADLSALGFEVYTDKAGALPRVESNGNNVYAFLPGDPGCEPMLFSSHLDTVTPGRGIEPFIEDGYIRSQPDRVLGADCKAGVAAIMEAARAIIEDGVPHRPIEIIFPIREESGIAGSAHLEYDRIRSKVGLVLDASNEPGKFVINAPGQIRIYADIYGKRSHAGSDPEKGISAIMAGARAVANMKLLRIDEETTANVGTLSGIGQTNVVHDIVRFEAEARSLDQEKLEAQAQNMIDCLTEACDHYGARLELTTFQSYKSYKHSPDDPHVQFLMARCTAAGIKPWATFSGGGTDGNNLNANGIKCAVMACGMEMEHTTSEQVSVQNLYDSARVVYEIMKK